MRKQTVVNGVTCKTAKLDWHSESAGLTVPYNERLPETSGEDVKEQKSQHDERREATAATVAMIVRQRREV